MTAALEYSPGSGSLVVAGSRACLIADDPRVAPVGQIWSVLTHELGESGVEGVFEALTGAYGFRDLPDFVLLLVEEGRLRVVRRGDIPLWDGSEPETASPVDLEAQTPWATHDLEITSVRVGNVGSRGLPLAAGVVAAQGFTWETSTGTRAPVVRSESAIAASAAPDAQSIASPAEPEPLPESARAAGGSGYTALFDRIRPGGAVPGGEVPADPAAPSPKGSTQTWSDTSAPDVRSEVVPASAAPAEPRRAQVPPPRTARSAAAEEPRRTGGAPNTTSAHRSIPDVRAVACPAGHWNASNVASCRVCRVNIPRQPSVTMPRPSLGRLFLPAGEVLEVDRGAIFGRAPHTPDGAHERPHLINVSKYGPHLSRMHAEIAIEGWSVIVRDLGSTEGTTLVVPGQQPRLLVPDEPALLRTGSTIDLAGDYAITFEAH